MMTYKNSILFLSLLILTGCGSWPTLHEKAPYADDQFNPMGQIYRSGLPAYLGDFQVLKNGNVVKANNNFMNAFVDSVKSARIFSKIETGKPTSEEKNFVKLALRASENEETHDAANKAKGFFIGLTFFVLSPFITLDYEFEQELILQATRWDGKVKNYSAKSRGSSKFSLNHGPEAGSNLRDQISKANRNSLVNQLAHDHAFYQLDTQ